MFRSNCEPTIDEIMRDPMVRALMTADRVDTVKFEAKLRGLARSIRRRPSSFSEPAGVPSRRLPLALAHEHPVADRHSW